jgi:hypothetical protein
MKIYVILWPGNEYNDGEVNAYLNREDWLARLHAAHDGESDGVAELPEAEFLKYLANHSDCQGAELDLIGSNEKAPYQKVVVLLRNDGGLNPRVVGTVNDIQDLVAVYSTPADLPLLLAEDILHHIQVEG